MFLFMLSTLSAFFILSFLIFLSRKTPIISESPRFMLFMIGDLTCILGTNLLDTSYLYNFDVDLKDFWYYIFSL